MHECMPVSLLLKSKTKGNFSHCFAGFCWFSKQALCLQKISHVDAKGRPIKAGKFFNLNEYIGKKTRQLSISLF